MAWSISVLESKCRPLVVVILFRKKEVQIVGLRLKKKIQLGCFFTGQKYLANNQVFLWPLQSNHGDKTSSDETDAGPVPTWLADEGSTWVVTPQFVCWCAWKKLGRFGAGGAWGSAIIKIPALSSSVRVRQRQLGTDLMMMSGFVKRNCSTITCIKLLSSVAQKSGFEFFLKIVLWGFLGNCPWACIFSCNIGPK